MHALLYFMSSVRVPPDLLAQLHEATPPGVPLARTIERALKQAGGPGELGRLQAGDERRARARAQVARLRRMGHRSVRLDPDEQVALAETARAWCQLLSAEGLRSYDPATRSMALASPRRASPSLGGFTWQRSGEAGL